MQAKWLQVATTGLLSVIAKGRASLRFEGLHASDKRIFEEFFQSVFGVAIETEQVHAAGTNWGDLEFTEKTAMDLTVEGKTVLELNLNDVSQVRKQGGAGVMSTMLTARACVQCAVPAKNEVELQFYEDDTGAREVRCLSVPVAYLGAHMAQYSALRPAAQEEGLVEMRLYVPEDAEIPEAKGDAESAAHVRGTRCPLCPGIGADQGPCA